MWLQCFVEWVSRGEERGVRVRVAIVGASGFVGSTLTTKMAEAGHTVVAIGRRLHALPSGSSIEPRAVDVADHDALRQALTGCEAAYYLVHSMDVGAFERKDAHLASRMGQAAADAGVGRIIYLGALGDAPTSRHLKSRREVGEALGSAGVPIVELRAAVILGAGSISFEMLRYLVERLPFMVCPRWVKTRIEPIGQRDVFRYLEGALTVTPGPYEIGCGRVTSYRELMDVYCDVRGLQRRVIIDVPLLTLRLSSYWVDFITPVNQTVSHALIESLSSEVVVHDRPRTQAAFGFTPSPLADAMREALADQVQEVSADVVHRPTGLQDGVYTVRRERAVPPGAAVAVREHLRAVGGDLGWYGVRPLWQLRLSIGNLLGERNRLRAPRIRERGEPADWWMIEQATDDTLVLRSRGWIFGEAWLAYRVAGDTSVSQSASFRPKGVPGFGYWMLLRPIHERVFGAMADHLLPHVRSARRSNPPSYL